MVLFSNVTILFGVLKYTRFFGLSNVLGIVHIIAFLLLVILGEVLF